jgi:hypothetical protein
MVTKSLSADKLSTDLPNGPVAAALLAGGIGAAVIGLMTVLAEASPAISAALTWSSPVGALSGKTGVGVIVFFLAWIVLHSMYRGKNVDFNKFATLAFVLLAIGLLFTFPPFFVLFAPK